MFNLRRWATILFVVIVSAGWILPIWLCADSLIHWVELRESHQLASFPYLHFARQMLGVGCLWLAAVVAAWAWVLCGRRC